MGQETKLDRFAKYAWFALAWNIVVIVWGVFLRASKSGDGCGEHWLTCNGELIPSAPQFKTVIEFSHRMTTAVDGIVMLILVVWAVRIWMSSRDRRNRNILIAAIGSLFFVITEAAVGAGLVLTGNTAEAVTDARPFWAMGHLINTFILLTFLTVTAWLASGERRVVKWPETKVLLLIGLGFVLLFLVGMSGTLAALSNMLFPSTSIAEGIAKDFSATSNVILRLRLSHPILSILTAVYLVFLAGWLKARAGDAADVRWWSGTLSLLVIVQVAFGAVTLLTLGPIVMQLGHLFLADAVWIAKVMMTAYYFVVEPREDSA
ncbi:MAG: COX15/CtaA family protein [Pyrinomonadaceae bacterium]|nr:COX15/CtaA family protein [Pyrinomonadaceae bacterium]MBP6212621.1 COX15/CtaA family protein [Pyrinomonadaceae bacterium]